MLWNRLVCLPHLNDPMCTVHSELRTGSGLFVCLLQLLQYWHQDQTFTAMKPWDVPHLAEGSAAPQVDHDKVTVYNMRYQVWSKEFPSTLNFANLTSLNLLFRFCPFAQRTILVLLAKNIPFDVVNINLKKKPEWFLEETWGLVSVVRFSRFMIIRSEEG
jgi:hypothetical protein